MRPDPPTPGTEIEQPWAHDSKEVLRRLGVDGPSGLTAVEAHARLERYGLNALREEPRTPLWRRLLSQFKSPVVLTLLVGTVVSALIGEAIDSAVIAAILAINATIGAFQEARAEQAVAALKKLAAPKSRSLRNGSIVEVRAEEIVPGDLLVLEAGDFVPADSRVLSSSQLTVSEAILTGESLPVEKHTEPLPAETLTAERANMMFGGTTVASGTGRAVVTETGMRTEIGRIAALLGEARPGPTPLQLRLETLGNRLLLVCAGVVLVVGLLGAARGTPWLEVLMASLSLAVAAIPEGLPAIVTIALALAIGRMARRNAIVRLLPAVETLGSTDVICTDKTGTLTTGEMRVREIVVDGRSVDPRDPAARAVLAVAALCSNASLGDDGSATGDMTEVAILRAARENGIDLPGLSGSAIRESERPFDSARKRMSVSVREDGATSRVLVKGAPESVLSRCRPETFSHPAIEAELSRLAAAGRRLLAVAEGQAEGSSAEEVERDLRCLGRTPMPDPPRPEAAEAIRECRAAGIRTVMVTGDHPTTARAVAGELGMLAASSFDEVLTGADLDRLTPEELAARVDRVAVFARVTPEHKLAIVRAWKSRGKIVAMTGDGVNDAPALKEASIGIAMGRGGTEVARQASAMVLTDDNFATIVSAVEEGRAIYGNIRRTIQYLLSGNLAEILVMLGAALAGWPLPLAPIQLLWINLVSDGLPALALAAEPVPARALRESRRPSRRMDPTFYWGILLIGSISAGLTLAVYGFALERVGVEAARSHAFSFLVFEELFRSFASRSEARTFFQTGWRSNALLLAAVSIPILLQIGMHHIPGLGSVFKVHPVTLSTCLTYIAIALIPVTALEIYKLWRQKRLGNSPQPR